MAGYMNIGYFLVNNIGAFAVHIINNLGNRLFIAGYEFRG